MKRFIFLTIIFLATPFVANGATEFISIIDPGNGSGTDYTSLSAWEAANQVDLTAATTLVIAGSLTRGTIADGVAITQTTTGATAICVHHSATQILISTLSGTPDATSTWYPTVDGSDATNAWTPTDVGDSAIAIAKCRSTAGTADTTAVTIDGWTTSATNYIKVWTDPSENYRHNGKWDEGKYRLAIASGVAITISEENVYIFGAQISSVNNSAIYVNGATGSSAIQISQNILKGNVTASMRGVYLNVTGASSFSKIWNNIIYDYSGTSGAGVYWNDADWTVYAYNNTIQNCAIGFSRGNDTAQYTKNNIISATDSFSGTFTDNDANNNYNAITENNVGEVAIGTNGKYNQVFMFADEANDDFHLDSADTAARNAGTILYDSGDDANLNFTTDVDNNSRLNSVGTWDIGADEVITKVYRSVGPSATTALAVGGTYGNVEVKPTYLAGSTTTITDYIASFWSDLPTNVGVGDALQYDDDDDGDIDVSDSIVFITKRIDASHFSVRTASGAAPASTLAPDSDWSIFRAYTSLFNAEAGTENTGIDADLVNFDTWTNGKNIQTSQEQWNIAAYANGTTADTVAVSISSWTTTADSYIKIYTPTRSDEAGTSQRHEGVWDDGKYSLSTGTGSYSVYVSQNYTIVDGLQITNSGTASTDYDIQFFGYRNYITVKNNIIKNGNIGIYAAIGNVSNGGHKIYNNIIYGAYVSGIRIYLSGASPLASYIYNNTVYNCNNSNTAFRSGVSFTAADVLINNIAMNNGVADFAGSGVQSYNISSDTSAVGTGSLTNQALTDIDFVSTTAGSEDLHILPTTVAKNIGTDLSNDSYIPFNTDITSTCLRKDNESRVANGGDDQCYTRPRQGSGVAQWDIGAHELITKIYRSMAPGEDEVLETGASNHLNISDSTATFDIALGNDVGVGDALEYDDDNDGDIDASDSIVFITGRTSSTVFTIKTATGGVPTTPSAADEIHWNINRAYTSLTNAEAGTENTLIDSDLRNFDTGNRDIAANSEQWNIACYAHGTTADTTAVTIDGWTTAPQNYIKIFTPTLTSEVGISQRHQGKWDDSKYKREGASMNTTTEDDYVRIDGLQIKHTRSSGTGYGLLVQYVSSSSDIRLSNNIVAGVLSGTAVGYGIWINDADAKVKLLNNIIYGFINPGQTSLAGLAHTAANLYSYFYSNTIYNCYRGFNINASSSTIKNNLSYNNTTDYYLVSNAVHSNNLSKDATSPDVALRNSNVSFVDSSNSDFHLLPTDTSARNAGVDLSQDFWLPITSDVDGQNKFSIFNFQFSNPDIGADESATAIYRSVGPSKTDALATGAGNNLTISGTTATFASTVEGTNAVGVGDVIQYDSDGNDSIDAIAFISARTSGTSFAVQSRDGANPVATTDDQNWSIFRAYTTLDNAEGGAENITNIDDDVDDFDISVSRNDGKDIYVSNEQWNIVAYANGTTADTNAVTINSWTTYLTNYIKIYTPVSVSEVGTSQRHSGVWDDNKYRLITTTDSRIVYNQIENVVFDGIQIARTGGVSANNECIRTTRAITVKNSILKGHAYGIYVVGIGTVSNSHISNSVFYDHASSSIRNEATGSSVYVYNVTSMDCGYRGVYNHTGTMYVKNTISMNSVSANFVGITSQENNLTSGVSFVDEANSDFHLASTDTGARDAGANLWDDSVLPVREDIDGDPRSEQGSWDIGADEGIFYQSNVAGHGTATMQMSLTDKMTDGLVGMWSFDGPDISGTTAYDRSPAGGNNGTITGATPAIGKKGQALNFNGTTDYVNVGDVGSGTQAISFWMKTDDATSRKIINIDGTDQIEIDGAGNILATSFPSATVYVDGAVSPAVDTDWHFVTITDATGVNASTFQIGQVATSFFDGIIDEVRVYNRALSADEIGKLYRLGSVEYTH